MQIKKQSGSKLVVKIIATHLQSSQHFLKKIDNTSYFRLSVSKDVLLLGEMVKSIKPAKLGNKFYLGLAEIVLQKQIHQPYKTEYLTMKLKQQKSKEQIIWAQGKFSIQKFQNDFVKIKEKHFPLLEVSLKSIKQNYNISVFVNVFIVKERRQLESVVKEHHEKEKEKRLEQKKKQKKIESVIIEQKSSPKRPLSNPESEINISSNSNSIKIIFEEEVQQEEQIEQKIPTIKEESTNIVSHFFFGKKSENYSSLKQQQTGFQLIENSKQLSTLSDGSQYSQMITNNEHESYSEKSLKKFYGRINICSNFFLIALAIFCIYILFSPSRQFQKKKKGKKSSKNSYF